ncbi:hypothetical protein KAU33_01700 [Candidatus Dependentiae bacterium]|nr:hypothetical protein [Candidatus Dependentiae bacterium]
MTQLIDTLIGFLRKPKTGFIIGVIFIFASFLPHVPLCVVQILRYLASLFFGIVVHNLWQSRIIEKERCEERIKVIEKFTGLQLLGLKEILPERDSREIGNKTFGFPERLKQFLPKDELIIIGITTGFLPRHFSDQISSFLTRNSTLKLKICVLDPASPCANLRSEEVFSKTNKSKTTTRKNINTAIAEWKELRTKFPCQIKLKKSMAIPYGEYEAVDIYVKEKEGLIYYTPIGYKAHTNQTPSFLFSPNPLSSQSPENSVLYNFHKQIIKEILDAAKDII